MNESPSKPSFDADGDAVGVKWWEMEMRQLEEFFSTPRFNKSFIDGEENGVQACLCH